jgi:hypothetical protein
MTRQQLIDAVWDELPAKRYLLGRKRGERLIERAIKRWPVPVLYQCDAQQTAVVGEHLARSLERQERAEYGMGFLTSIILAAIISEIVKILIRRWLENRVEMLEALS